MKHCLRVYSKAFELGVNYTNTTCGLNAGEDEYFHDTTFRTEPSKHMIL